MADYDLVVTIAGNAPERYRVSAQGLLIGRGPGNHVSIHDQQVSRRHARIWVEDTGLNIEDMGSRNGILLNGKVTRRSAVKPGDIIAIGQAVIQIRACTGSTVGHTIIGPDIAESVHAAIMKEASGIRLPILYKAAQLLGTVFDADVLLGEILALIFSALPVRRGFVLVRDQENGELEVHATLSKETGEEGPPLSRTLIQHVFDKREAMLTVDAQEDSRFVDADSIMGHGIHSAMCAPLIGRESVVGAIYVDSGSGSATFASEDLGLLTAIARVVGVAVENARLYQENVRQERLAVIGEATANMGHCVKNILTGLRGGSEFITMAIEKKELRYLEKGWPILSRSIDRIDTLVMNMLSLSKERQPERMPVNINTLVNEVVDTLRERAQRYKVLFEVHDAQEGVMHVDAQQIYRVILNLLNNAIEASVSTGGVVSITCANDSDGFRIRIADSGCGIPPELMPRLFQAFSSSKGASGTGLGLACSLKIAREHGGTIEVESKPGKGSVFTVVLPHMPNTGSPTMEIHSRPKG